MEESGIVTKPFDLKLSTEGSGNSIGLVGATKSGKSFALSYILKHYFKKHLTVLMTNSPQAAIYKSMTNCVQSPQYIPKILKDMSQINRQTDNHYDFLCVMDDIVTGTKFDKEVIKLLCIGRNNGQSAILSVQDITLLNSAGRNNVNFMIFLKLNTDDRIEMVCKHYLRSWLPRTWKIQDCIRFYKMNTQDHYFFVLDTLIGELYRSKIGI